jgi:RHS repeat-associated protein
MPPNVMKMSYRYTGTGERVYRSGSGQTAHTVFDPSGRWIGDYDENGQTIQQAIWLGDLPVGLIARVDGQSQLFYLQPDALGTPRVVIDPARGAQGAAVWRWELENEAFGEDVPNDDPDNDGNAFVLDMRFPGQQYDSATGFNYNYYRDYDAESGRYVQSDPIGLAGGISTYGYVRGNPLLLSDFFGLAVDINLFPAGSSEYRGAQNYNSNPSECTIAGHGTPNSVGGRSAQSLIEIINKNPSCQDKPIRLVACNAGVSPSRGYSIAQRLANAIQQNVYAPNNWGWLSMRGNLYIGPAIGNLPWTAGEAAANAAGPDYTKPGSFVLFTPRKK